MAEESADKIAPARRGDWKQEPMPDSIAQTLPENGRTLAFAVFPPYQRQGYFEMLKYHLGGKINENNSPAELQIKSADTSYLRHGSDICRLVSLLLLGSNIYQSQNIQRFNSLYRDVFRWDELAE